MTDFDMTQWCDFVRGLADPDAEREMRRHLASGKRGARRKVDVLSRIQSVAKADTELEIPDYAVRMAKAIGMVRRVSAEVPSSSIRRFLPFQLTFDSEQTPALAGTRDMQTSFRQMSFTAEGYAVELRLEPDVAKRSSVLVGQVLEVTGNPSPMAEIPVLLVSEGKIVERAVTSRFGEFQAEDLPQSQLDLYVMVDSENCIKLPLEEKTA